MARFGLCSRREAEKWVRGGRVRVNGLTLTDPATNVTAECKIHVDGQLLGDPEATRLWRYHKPKGLLTSHRDPQGRPTIFDSLSTSIPRVVSVGRLDMNSEGLLLLTNDGALARRMELPATGLTRSYRVRVHGFVNKTALAKLKNGITIDGLHYGSVEALLDRQVGHNAWLSVALKEGKNREIRNVLRGIGLTVNRLIRVGYGPFSLGSLPSGAAVEIANFKIESYNLPS